MYVLIKRILVCSIALIAIIVLGATIAVRWSHVNVEPPPPPQGKISSLTVPATSSHLPIAISIPKSAIASQLEKKIPKTFPFDINKGGVRVYGTPSRGPINVVNDVIAKRFSFSVPVLGKVQIEKRIKIDVGPKKIDKLFAIGINISSDVRASMSPVIAMNWKINPQLDLSTHVNQATVSTLAGGIDITEHVQDGVAKAVKELKAVIEKTLWEGFDIQKEVERLWNKIDSAYMLADNPPKWLRISPQKVTFGEFHYTNDSIELRLALDLKSHVYLQDAKPEVLKTPMPDLQIARTLSDDFNLSIPFDVSYSVINQQLKTKLTKSPIDLPPHASATITDVSIAPYGDGILVIVDVMGKNGLFKSVSGRLYLVGIPVFDSSKAELHVDNLEYTADTKSTLLNSVDWLGHSAILEMVKRAAVINLEDKLREVTKKANAELDSLKAKLPKEIDANGLVSTISIDHLVFAKDRVYLVATAKGKLSAQLKP